MTGEEGGNSGSLLLTLHSDPFLSTSVSTQTRLDPGALLEPGEHPTPTPVQVLPRVE